MIVLTIFGKLPPSGTNTIDRIMIAIFGATPSAGMHPWIGFIAALLFIVMFVALPFITKRDSKSIKGA